MTLTDHIDLSHTMAERGTPRNQQKAIYRTIEVAEELADLIKKHYNDVPKELQDILTGEMKTTTN